MNGYALIYGFIPGIVSAALIVCSYLLFIGYPRSLTNVILLVITLIVNAIAISHLLDIMQGSKLSYLPYILVIASIPVFIWQYKTFKIHWQQTKN